LRPRAVMALRVWVPKRIIPRLGALSVVSIYAKRTQFSEVKCAKQSQFGPGSQTGARVAGRARRGTTAPNKANSRRGKKKGKCLAGKDLW
jgi:hypothetical protein